MLKKRERKNIYILFGLIKLTIIQFLPLYPHRFSECFPNGNPMLVFSLSIQLIRKQLIHAMNLKQTLSWRKVVNHFLLFLFSINQKKNHQTKRNPR